MSGITRRDWIAGVAAAAISSWVWGQGSQAGGYPGKVVKFVVPYPAAGGNDLLARALKTAWEGTWRQPVIVENKPGGNGTLGAEFVSESPGDGYTLLMGSIATHAIVPALSGKSMRYDYVKGFTPIAMVGWTPLILTVHPSVPANNLQEFIALAKKGKDAMNYASVGKGSAGHLAGALFEQLAGVDMLHIPYKGIAQASTELVGGVVSAAFSNVINVLPLIQTGKLKALGVTGETALDILPGVPPIASVLPGYSVELWWGIFGPAGMPKDVVEKIWEETNKYLLLPESKNKWIQYGITLRPMTTSDFVAQITKDHAKWSELIAARKITGE